MLVVNKAEVVLQWSEEKCRVSLSGDNEFPVLTGGEGVDVSYSSSDEDVAESASFLGIQLYDAQSLMHLCIHFAFNLLVSWVLVHLLYYRKSGRKDYYFTFLMFSSAMFILLFVLENIKLQIGFALGLFAIFGMIRYRTETIPVREMTYLFVLIALSIVNGLALNMSYAELILANCLILGLTWILESGRIIARTSTKLVTYDRIELIVPERREELIADLENRIGVKIKAVEIGSVDFLRDSAFIKVTYVLPYGESGSVDQLRKEKDYTG